MKLFNTLLLFVGIWAAAKAANPPQIKTSLNWEESPQGITLEGQVVEYWSFEGAVASSNPPGLPVFTERFRVDGSGQLSVSIAEANYEPFEWGKAPEAAEQLGASPEFEANVTRHREGYFGKIAFVPIVRRNGQYERLTSFTLKIALRPQPAPQAQRGPNNTDLSKLANGELYKLAIPATGVYKITAAFLTNELGIDLAGVDPGSIRVLGAPGGKLPYYSEAPRQDDLAELPIQIVDGGDGTINGNDYLLFYAQGPDQWRYNEARRQFEMQRNIYDSRNYCFLQILPGNGARISSRLSVSSTAADITTFRDYSRYEPDLINLFKEWTKAQGSGKHWYGDQFRNAREYTYNDIFNFPNIVPGSPVYVQARMALRARVSSSFFTNIGGTELESSRVAAITTINTNSDNINAYAREALLRDSFLAEQEQLPVTVRYPFPQGAGDESEGWLDWVQFNVTRQLAMTGGQMAFRSPESRAFAAVRYQVAQANEGLMVWDVTNPVSPVAQAFNFSGGTLSFGANTDGLIREFVAFDPAQPLLQPEAIGPVPNQNLHGIAEVDMVIVSPPDFEQEALRLAQHRSELSGMTIQIVTPEQIYNEFSGGRAEPTAIRDFSRMLYDRSNRFRYLLLMGDASFDYRDIYGFGGNFVPVYQKENFNPVEAYPTDDFLALLYSGNESDPLSGDLYINVGRLPVKTVQEARNMVDKVIRYDLNPQTYGDWRNRLTFVGDDDDGPGDIAHFRQADDIAEDMQELVPFVNLDKIYLDAFPQESTPGGERFPLATEQLNRSIFRGALAVTYLGHGGPRGWAQERVLNISDILSWDNAMQLPVFVTATCSFTGYDDPELVTAGEEVILNPNGGASALMTTVRAVYANSNERMTRNALTYLLQRDSTTGRPRAVGEAFRLGKNDVSSSFDVNNSRKFSLIGDPSMPVALPRQEVITTAVNGIAISPADTLPIDTLRALQKVTIQGAVLAADGSVDNNFNGIVYPTLFDKAQTVTTLAQGANVPYNYRIQQNVIFKGRASVTNGVFEFSFVVPRDINYTFGAGKISYYAADQARKTDAAGSYEGIVIGGSDPNGITDDQGPQVEVFMNTASFVFGSVVSPNPTLLVRLSDDNGINVVGNSIGHDLEGVLNGNTQNTYLLNDFYESELDDYTRGTVRYPLSQLPEGRHRIEVKAWDVANNSATGFTEFVVAGSAGIALQHVLNYPNPFTDRTCFQFDHNLHNQDLDVLIQIYTVSGRLVKTLEQTVFTDGAIRQGDCIEWDGRDDFGDQLARGVYLYKVKVRGAGIGSIGRSGESDFEKLVILK